MRNPTASTLCSRFLVVLDGAAQTCGKHVEILERKKNIDPSVDSFGRLEKESVTQKNNGVARNIYTQPTYAEKQLILHHPPVLGINEINLALISLIVLLTPFLRLQRYIAGICSLLCLFSRTLR